METYSEIHSQTLGQPQGIFLKKERKDCRNQRHNKKTHINNYEINYHRISQSLNQQPVSLCGNDLYVTVL